MSSAVALLAQGIAVAQGGGTATVVQLPAEQQQQQQQQQQQPPAQQQQQQQQQASTSGVAGACRAEPCHSELSRTWPCIDTHRPCFDCLFCRAPGAAAHAQEEEEGQGERSDRLSGLPQRQQLAANLGRGASQAT